MKCTSLAATTRRIIKMDGICVALYLSSVHRRIRACSQVREPAGELSGGRNEDGGGRLHLRSVEASGSPGKLLALHGNARWLTRMLKNCKRIYRTSEKNVAENRTCRRKFFMSRRSATDRVINIFSNKLLPGSLGAPGTGDNSR